MGGAPSPKCKHFGAYNLVDITIDRTVTIVRFDIAQSDMSFCGWVGHRADQATTSPNGAWIHN